MTEIASATDISITALGLRILIVTVLQHRVRLWRAVACVEARDRDAPAVETVVQYTQYAVEAVKLPTTTSTVLLLESAK